MVPEEFTAVSGLPPSQELSAALAGIYRTALGIEACGPDDSLFQLGGSSLDAMRVLGVIQSRFGVGVPLADLYQHGTPAMLAARLRAAGRATGRTRRSLTARARRRGAWLPLAPGQESFYRTDRATGGLGLFNNVIQLRFTGGLATERLGEALDDVVARQTALSLVFCQREDTGEPAQRVAAGPARVRTVDLREGGERAVRRLARREYLVGFDLHAEPPIRFTLARTGEDQWDLLCTAHHIVFDGLSRHILVDEIAHAYAARCGAVAPRPPLEEDYTDFVEWQRTRLSGEWFLAQLDELAATLREPAPRLTRPLGRTRAFASRMDPLDLPSGTAAAVDVLAAGLATTVFVVVAGAVVEFLRRATGRSRQVLLIQCANRGRPGSEQVIGCFATMACVAVDLDGASEPREVVAATHLGVARALRQEELPLDVALHALAGRGEDLLTEGRLPQLGLVLQPAVEAAVELPGCSLSARRVIQDGKNIDPTTFPLVLEFSAGAGGLHGDAHRLLDHWSDRDFAAACQELNDVFAGFAAVAAEFAPGEGVPA